MDVAFAVRGLLDGERSFQLDLVATTGTACPDRHDRRPAVARHPDRARWQRRFAAEQGHRFPILKEVAVGDEDGDLAPFQRLQHPAHPGRRRFDDRVAVRPPEVRHAVEDEARGGAGGHGGQRVAPGVDRLADEIERAEVGADQHQPLARCQPPVQHLPFAGHQPGVLQKPAARRARDQHQIHEIAGAGVEHVARGAEQFVLGSVRHRLAQVGKDVVAVGARTPHEGVAAANANLLPKPKR